MAVYKFIRSRLQTHVYTVPARNICCAQNDKSEYCKFSFFEKNLSRAFEYIERSVKNRNLNLVSKS